VLLYCFYKVNGVTVKKIIFLVVLLCAAVILLSQQEDWKSIARNDLAAIHEILSHNHPGVLNTDDVQFNNWLHEYTESHLPRKLWDGLSSHAQHILRWQRVKKL